MNVRILPRPLRGTVTVPGSKSMAHRLLAAASLAEGTSVLRNVPDSRDIQATLRCIAALGGQWAWEGNTLSVTGGTRPPEMPRLDCGESGSTLRFFLPVALVLAGGGVFTGQGRLLDRPLDPYWKLLDERGIFHETRDGGLTVRGRLEPGAYRLPGDVSSQFFTGLLLALSRLDGISTVESTTELESAAYVDMTLQALRAAGIPAEKTPAFRVEGRRKHTPFAADVEGDWSQGAFWYAANFLGGDVIVRGLDPRSAQGDRAVADWCRRLAREGTVEVDLSGIPDLLPPLAVMAAVRRGETRFLRAGRLRLKESDRLDTVSRLLQAFGVRAEAGPDWLTVGPCQETETAETVEVEGCNDHRVVMAAAVLASAGARPVVIHGAEAVEKSYPAFFDDYRTLGGIADVL